jgi:hypothetical protein
MLCYVCNRFTDGIKWLPMLGMKIYSSVSDPTDMAMFAAWFDIGVVPQQPVEPRHHLFVLGIHDDGVK